MRNLTAVAGDVFAGLFAVGVKQAGFDVVGDLEHCDYGARTFALNFPKTKRREGVDSWRPRDFRGAGLFFTNPPCAPWSNLNANTSTWRADPRIWWIDDLIDAALDMRPKTWVWESVIPAWTKGNAFVVDKASRFEKAGYSVAVVLQNNAYLGVPQDRKRMLFVAHKHPLIFPKLTEPRTVAKTIDGISSTADDLTGAQEMVWPRGKWLWKQSKNLGGYLHRAHYANLDRGPKGMTPSFMWIRVDPDRPAPVLTEQRMHPHEPRVFTFAERKALCGLPQSWKSGVDFHKTTLECQRAVMPPVGRWIATAVKDGLKLPPIRRPEFKVYDFRKPNARTVETFLPVAMDPGDIPPRPAPGDPPPAKAKRSTVAVAPRPSGPRLGTSKEYVCGRLKADRYNLSRRPPKDWADGVAAEVREKFTGRTTKASDVYWIWARQEGP